MAYEFGGTFIFSTSSQTKVKADEVYKKVEELNIFFSKYRIYFSKELASLLENFMGTISNTVSEYHEIPDTSKERTQFEKEFLDQLPEIKNKLSSLKTNIEDEFRSILGVDHSWVG